MTTSVAANLMMCMAHPQGIEPRSLSQRECPKRTSSIVNDTLGRPAVNYLEL